MTLREFAGFFVRQCAAAAIWLAAILCVAERLSPGSVLPFFPLFPLVILAFGLSVLAPARPTISRFRLIPFLPILFLIVAFLFLIASDLGRGGLLLTASALIVGLAFL